MTETGYQVIPAWSALGLEDGETNPELQWPKSNLVFDKMRREDSQVGSVLRAVTFPVRSATWQIDGTGCRPEVIDLIASDLGLPVKGQEPKAPLRTRDRFSWSEHLRLALLELPFGHSFFEQVYVVDGTTAHLKKLAWRPPTTISGIEVAADGGLVSISQQGTTSGEIKIPVARLVAYVNEREGGNWFGTSLIRAAYKNWLLKDRILRTQALTVERNGLGVPVYEGAPVPDGAQPDEREKWQSSEKAAGLAVAKGFRAGEAAGASIPHGAKLTLTGVTGDLPDTDKPIRYHDEQIARAVLAHFLNLGTETGSWALGSTFADFFVQSLNAVAAHIADVTQQHVIEDLVDLNFGPAEPAPRLVFDPIGSEFPATAEAISALVTAGVLTVDDPIEDWVRATYGMPVRDPSTAREADPAPEETPNAPSPAADPSAVVPNRAQSRRRGPVARLRGRLHL